MHGNDCPLNHNPGDSIFFTQCEVCGVFCCYADDGRGELSEKLTKKYKVNADIKLKVNYDKTNLLVMTTHSRQPDSCIYLIFTNKPEKVGHA